MKDIAPYTQGQLFSVPFIAKKANILSEALQLMRDFPEILSRIAADQDAHALAKKELRVLDSQWYAEHHQPMLLELEEATGGLTVEPLGTGRPRMRVEAVYLFIIARGLYGSPCDETAWERMSDSSTFRYFIGPYIGSFPGQTTVLEQINSMSKDTLNFIFQCQFSTILDLGLDDLKTTFIDSTHIHSRSDWPTDSSLILKTLDRAFKLGQKLEAFDLANFRLWSCPRWLDELSSLDFAINMAKKKKNRQFRRTYKKFLEKALKLETRLGKEYDKYDELVSGADLPPSRRKMLDSLWNLLLDSLVEASVLNEFAYRRVILGEDMKDEDIDRILSASDRSAAFIEKGGREKVFGYRVQFARSSNGFISSVIVPEGNAADAKMLIPVVDDHIANTGITPVSVSTDDGYSSGSGREELMNRLKVRNVSINGAKGRKITPEDDWNSELYAALRSNRSSVESLMFTGKHKFNFGQFQRCGIEAVRVEMLEKVIAHNFWRIAYEKQRRKVIAPAA